MKNPIFQRTTILEQRQHHTFSNQNCPLFPLMMMVQANKQVGKANATANREGPKHRTRVFVVARPAKLPHHGKKREDGPEKGKLRAKVGGAAAQPDHSQLGKFSVGCLFVGNGIDGWRFLTAQKSNKNHQSNKENHCLMAFLLSASSSIRSKVQINLVDF